MQTQLKVVRNTVEQRADGTDALIGAASNSAARELVALREEMQQVRQAEVARANATLRVLQSRGGDADGGGAFREPRAVVVCRPPAGK
jgi:hypothetical protein